VVVMRFEADSEEAIKRIQAEFKLSYWQPSQMQNFLSRV
jgi:hypothetical protein